MAGKSESMIKESQVERREIHAQFEKLITKEQKSKNSSSAALSYVRHIHYIDLEEFQPQIRPTWISLVRDPLERAISWYYYQLTPWYKLKFDPELNETVLTEKVSVREVKTSLDECVEAKLPECSFNIGQPLHQGKRGPAHASQIAFFCGHDPEVCGEFGSEAALARAMENVERRFAVVGITEEFDKTLEVLEAYVPRFFRDAREVYTETMDKQKVNRNSFKPEVSPEVRAELRRNLTLEFEFYNFCKQRLDLQYSLVS